MRIAFNTFFSKVLSGLYKLGCYLKQKPSAPFIIVFIILLTKCAYLTASKVEEENQLVNLEYKKTAEQIAQKAYIFLVIGVGIEICQLIICREKKIKV